jgi:hypothetical protein
MFGKLNQTVQSYLEEMEAEEIVLEQDGGDL